MKLLAATVQSLGTSSLGEYYEDEASEIIRHTLADRSRHCCFSIPIVIYYGDNIPGQPMANPSQDQWRTRLAMARLWADAVNRRGGDVTVVHLPEIGIRGNTHFLFSDLNNLEIADVLSKFLEKKGLN